MTMVISGSDGVTFPDSTNQFSGGAFSFKNRLINGGMVIDQRNAGASVAVTSGTQFSVDRFSGNIFGSASGRFSIQQSSTAPTGFVNSVLVTVTTADAAPTSNFLYALIQNIEGTNIPDLSWGTANAKTATVSFWVRSSVTGTFPLIIQNNDADRAFGGQYVINSADTWEYKTVVVSGITSGTWLTTTGIGARVIFGFGGGTNRTISTGFQTVGSALTQSNVTGSTQLIATNGATFYITGVQLEVGSVATPFERRPFGAELALCQRYYARFGAGTSAFAGFGVGSASSTTAAYAYIKFPVTMRATPTFNGANLSLSDGVTGYAVTSNGTSLLGTDSGSQLVNVASGLTQFRTYFLGANNNTGAYIDLSSEL